MTGYTITEEQEHTFVLMPWLRDQVIGQRDKTLIVRLGDDGIYELSPGGLFRKLK